MLIFDQTVDQFNLKALLYCPHFFFWISIHHAEAVKYTVTICHPYLRDKGKYAALGIHYAALGPHYLP